MSALSGFGLACILFGAVGHQTSEILVGIGCVLIPFAARLVRAYRIVEDVANSIDTLSRNRVGYVNRPSNPNGAATAVTAPRHDSGGMTP